MVLSWDDEARYGRLTGLELRGTIVCGRRSAILAVLTAASGPAYRGKARKMTAGGAATGRAPRGLPVPGGDDGGTTAREHTDAAHGLARAAYS